MRARGFEVGASSLRRFRTGRGRRPLGSQSIRGPIIASLCALIGALALGAVPAQALNTHVFSTSFGSSGSGAGQVSSPAGVAVNSVTHDVYVADSGNLRVDEFSSSGTFIRAWGWGVADGLPAFETCTLVCQAGISGSGAGQFTTPKWIAVDNSKGASAEDVYVGDTGNNFVSKFSSTGTLISAWGSGGQLNGSTATQGPFGPLAGIAVGATGTLYVLDTSSNVFEFEQGDAFSTQFTAARGTSANGLAVDPTGEFFKANGGPSVEEGTAANSDVGQVTRSESTTGLVSDPVSGDLYVAESGDVEHYVFAAAGIVSDGASTCQVVPFNGCPATDTFGSGTLSGGSGIGVDHSSGSVFVADAVANRVDIFTPATLPDTTTEAATAVTKTTATLHGTVNSSGVEVSSCKFEWGTEAGVYPNSVACSSVPGSGSVPVAVSAELKGLAGNAVYHYRLVAANAIGANRGEDVSFRMPGAPAIDAESAEVKPKEKAGQTSATLRGQITPDGRETTYHFEYGETEAYGASIPASPASIGSGEGPVSVPAAEPSGLKVDTTYHYRLVASNEYGTVDGADQTFATLPPALFESESVSNVAATSATLEAQVNPLGNETIVHFQYGTASCTVNPAACTDVSVDAGAAESSHTNSIHLTGLTPGSQYHFRVIASNALGKLEGVDQTFTTQAAGTQFTLPDGRAWEMVSPPTKQGAGLIPIGYSEGEDIQAADSGGAMAYSATGSFVANPAGSRSFELAQIFSTRRAPGVWETHDITTPHDGGATSPQLGVASEYRLFSSDLSHGLLEPAGRAPLPPLPPGAEKTIYIRNDGECESTPTEAIPTTCYRALVTTADTPPGTKFGTEGGEFENATPDASHVVFHSEVALTLSSEAIGGGLYEWSGGQLRLVGVLPGPNGAPVDARLGREYLTRHAISNDGSRVVWTAGVFSSLYLRDMAREESILLGEEAYYETANSEDSRVFFMSSKRLTVDSTASSGPDLYEFELTSGKGEPLAGKLTDLSVDGNMGESADVRSVIGASEDGSYVYFVANGVLGDGAQHGVAKGTCEQTSEPAGQKCNLYMEHYDQAAKAWTPPTFIAALSGADAPSWGSFDLNPDLTNMTSRVSPSGRYLAFMSERSLTGYDNRDVSSGARDEEVFLYDASAGRVVCASCDPTGARPAGLLEAGENENLVNYAGNWTNRWVAGDIPGWDSEWVNTAIYQPRYLSNEGQLFFNSADHLVPADVNGKEDVYEYEPAGLGSCQGAGHGQSASIVFSAASGGCVGLISSGTSSGESAFMDASESGGDIFFMTGSQLAPQDYDTSLDVYDAHECSASQPCASSPPLQPPPCMTGDSCKPAPTPQPAIFGTPASATFSGAGNVVPPPVGAKKSTPKKSTLKKCRRGFVRKHGRCVKQKKAKKSARRGK
jgi:hypothetical protein